MCIRDRFFDWAKQLRDDMGMGLSNHPNERGDREIADWAEKAHDIIRMATCTIKHTITSA
eukprot:756966-Pyramimonas_sp.AAC.1